MNYAEYFENLFCESNEYPRTLDGAETLPTIKQLYKDIGWDFILPPTKTMDNMISYVVIYDDLAYLFIYSNGKETQFLIDDDDIKSYASDMFVVEVSEPLKEYGEQEDKEKNMSYHEDIEYELIRDVIEYVNRGKKVVLTKENGKINLSISNNH